MCKMNNKTKQTKIYNINNIKAMINNNQHKLNLKVKTNIQIKYPIYSKYSIN